MVYCSAAELDAKNRRTARGWLSIIKRVWSLIVLGGLGALIGSFANVVIYRLPRRESIAFPGSHCPKCNHAIKPWENIPIVSWLLLRGRCSSCKTPIALRYPLVEGLTAVCFVALGARWPLLEYGWTVIPLLLVTAMIIMMSFIDIDHFILPDSLTLPALAVALAGALVYEPQSGLPTLTEALVGAAIGAGIIALINRIGSLILRRLQDTKERLWPISMDQVNIAAVVGALGGWLWGIVAAAVSFAVNLVTRKTLRLPEAPLYGLWLVALLLSAADWLIPIAESLAGTLIATGVVALVGASYWWLYGLRHPPPEASEADDEPIAMGFGDVKLAAILGAILGWQSLLVALLFSFVIGAIGGLIGRLFGGDRVIPFGPYLALGGFFALFVGTPLISWYLGMLGI